MKVAVITPYYKEHGNVIARCLDSVSAQTVKCLHYLIADLPAPVFAEEQVHRHIALGEPHKDFGNTPRGIGGLLAVSEGAEAICFLDADNTYDPDHIETCIETAKKHPTVDFVIARRRIVLPDGTPVPGEDEPITRHVDTNCFFLLPGAFHVIPQQVLQPKELTIVGDRLFLAALEGLQCIATEKPTVTYTSEWRIHYEAAGVQPPETAKKSVDIEKLMRWWRGQTPMEHAIILRHLGLKRLWW